MEAQDSNMVLEPNKLKRAIGQKMVRQKSRQVIWSKIDEPK